MWLWHPLANVAFLAAGALALAVLLAAAYKAWGSRCLLLGHRWRVAQPIPFIPFDQGGVQCARCGEFYWVHSPEASEIAEQHGL